MPNLKASHFSKKNIALFFTSLLLCACASIQSPQGGPKDTEPPKILKMTPENLTRNFKAKKIVIEFDEYFNIKDEFK